MKERRRIWLYTVTLTVIALALAVAGCESAGAGGGGGGSSGGETPFTVIGNTLYSDDGGTTEQEASFQFSGTKPASATVSALNSSVDVPVTGQLRAGDILLNLAGSYNTDTGEFSIAASGTLLSIRIEVVINGAYNQQNGTVTGGDAITTVTNTNTNETTVFTTTTVANGESPTKPISDTTGTQQADPIPAAQRKFWEGTWTGRMTTYYVLNGEGLQETTAVTQYWSRTDIRVVATAAQYNLHNSYYLSPALAQLCTADCEGSDFEIGILREIVSESTTESNGYFEFPRAPAGERFDRMRIFLAGNGGLWGVSYAPCVEDDESDCGYPTLDEAKTAHPAGQAAPPPEWFLGTNVGLTKVQ